MAVDFSKIHLERLSNEEIRKRADEFRKQVWGNKIPVDIELIVERNLNLMVIPVSNLRYQAHTEAYLSADLTEIVYDPDTPDVRIRFSIAHEVGHLVLHSDIVKKLRPASYEDWKEIQKTIPDVLWGRAEYQAREFAGRLLVPREHLLEQLKRLQPQIAEATKMVPDLELPEIKELASRRIAKSFAVSNEVIVRRMEVEGISPIQE